MTKDMQDETAVERTVSINLLFKTGIGNCFTVKVIKVAIC